MPTPGRAHTTVLNALCLAARQPIAVEMAGSPMHYVNVCSDDSQFHATILLDHEERGNYILYTCIQHGGHS
ncbi:hypothetical protein FA95DRAFT_1553785 [Auriscalpium vulgare]|uniref:Uncharacterized protein n=1 Tax=Auriscalpium vulgare TaxID=40419 RepID=A0ACB8S826_9AGAM|nr:hypothetical protein FA95DRAFT_1553785 [Auriscalpium vulgare]